MLSKKYRKHQVLVFAALLFYGQSHGQSPEQSNVAAVEPLVWIPSADPKTLCQGYYSQSLTEELLQTPVSLSQGRTSIAADQVELQLEGRSVFNGNVVVIQPGRQLNADKIILFRDGKTKQFTHAQLLGQVVMQEVGKVMTGDSAEVDLTTHQARITHAGLRFVELETLQTALKRHKAQGASSPGLHITGQTARAGASTIQQHNENQFSLAEASYTTCPPGNDSWQLRAKSLQFNRSTGLGSAAHVVLTVKDFPILYFPYLFFPIDNRRHSGLLLPVVSVSKSGGVDFAQPIYWAMAPNYDLLVTPRYMQKRSMLWQGQFRYLNNRAFGVHEGHLRGGWIAHDSDFNHFRDQEAAELLAAGSHPPELDRLLNASARRDYIDWEHHSQFTDNLAWQVIFHHVSDDFILQDFGRLGLSTEENQLPQETWLTYDSEHWRAVLELSKYETLHPVNKPTVIEQYRRLPRLTLEGFYPEFLGRITGHFSSEYVDFDRKKNPGEILQPETGTRLHVQPGLSYPVHWGVGAYWTPRLDMAMTRYDLEHIPAPRGDDLTRALPIFSMDTGAFFETNVNLFGQPYVHTLEPRLFYLYSPERHQDEFPLFDTTLNMFTFDQLFRSNRFSGLDRLGDANQLSVAFTSRLLDLSGVEKMHFSLGGIIYFQDREVALCKLTGDVCIDTRSLVLREFLSDTSTLSPIVNELVYHLHPHWQFAANSAWDLDKHRLANGGMQLRYQPSDLQIITMGLSFLRGGDVLQSVSSPERDNRDLKQFHSAIVWPIAQHWNVLGRFHYNLSHGYTQDYMAGLEYQNCCWALRLVAGRTYKGLNVEHGLQYNREIYLQWQLKGLATIGTRHPKEGWVESISGYEDTFEAPFPEYF